MPYVTAHDVEQALANLIANNHGPILKAYVQKGGWENWLQVELANALNAQFSTVANILREDPSPYQNAGRVDILVTHRPIPNNPAMPHPIAVELKAESIFQAGNGNDIGGLATDDLNKIANHGNRAAFEFLALSVAVSKPGQVSLAAPYNGASQSPLVNETNVSSTPTNDELFPNIYHLSVRFT